MRKKDLSSRGGVMAVRKKFKWGATFTVGMEKCALLGRYMGDRGSPETQLPANLPLQQEKRGND